VDPRGSDTIIWQAVTTGNIMGFDAWMDDHGGNLSLTTNHGDLSLDLQQIGLDDIVLDAGGLERKLTVFRLPESQLEKEISLTRDIAIKPNGDNPIWICLTTEDGYQAWTSPIYVFR